MKGAYWPITSKVLDHIHVSMNYSSFRSHQSIVMHNSKKKKRAKAKDIGKCLLCLRYLLLMNICAFQCWADLNLVTWEGG